ncbi:MAG: SDR family NAD(P)-dependent oxidoreductase [Planctomycetota bacterium]|nr:SDR family NAD(P)-dependent oxidoreductase [Planctomycetota bacterium]MDA1113111.1 SDR family NAD(P)-dependent oxidoreductase [Planctomycetota bacterium]
MSARHSTVVITGAGSGIGRATAEAFAADGWDLLLVGRRDGKLKETISGLTNPNCASFAALDVAEPGAMHHAVQDFAAAKGGIDALVANAGINPQRANALTTTDDFWDETLRVNLTGTHRSCQAVLPFMQKAQSGAIVTLGSIAGQVGMVDRAAYGPSKAAVIEYTRNLALDFGADQIRANCVCPGFVVTDINRDWLEALPAETYSQLIGKHPLGLGAPEDVAAVILFLCKPGARWITGVDLSVDGGYTAQ